MFGWAQHWNSEEDFFNLSAGYLMDKNLKIWQTISMLSLIQ